MISRFLAFLCRMSILLLFLAFLGAVAGNAVFEQYAFEEATRRHLPKDARNSIKHAYAAGQLYRLLQGSGLPPENTLTLVLFLGEVNEVAEQIVKFSPKEDSAQEIFKDMHNNLAGALAAQKKTNLLSLIGRLAKDRILLITPQVHRANTEASLTKLKTAREKFRNNRREIEERVKNYLH